LEAADTEYQEKVSQAAELTKEIKDSEAGFTNYVIEAFASPTEPEPED